MKIIKNNKKLVLTKVGTWKLQVKSAYKTKKSITPALIPFL